MERLTLVCEIGCNKHGQGDGDLEEREILGSLEG